MPKFTCGIIGAGSIGALKPDHLDAPGTKFPLTHAHAIHDNPNLELAWIRDINQSKAIQANDKWGCKICDGIYDMYPADIIVIASPTNTHLKTIEDIIDLIDFRPKLFILEKPCGLNLTEATRIDYLCKEAGIPVIVNYGRRFSKFIRIGVQEIQKQEIQSIVFHYTRGMLRDGSHALDFINWIAGSFIEGEILDSAPILDYHSSDPTYALRLKYSRCENVFLTPIDGRIYDCFEVTVMTDKGRIVFDDHFLRMSLFGMKREDVYGDYHSLPSIISCPISYQTDLMFSLQLLYEHAYQVLIKKEQPDICNMENARRVHNIIDRLLIEKERKENAGN